MNASYRIDKLRLDIKQGMQHVAAREGQKKLLESQRDDAIVSGLDAAAKLGQLDKVLILLEKTSGHARLQVKGRIEDIVSQGCSVVYGEPHRFEIVMDTRGGIPVAEYWLENGGTRTQLKPPDYDRGGGKVDVVNLTLKLAVAELEQIEGPMLMDEVGKHVSAEYAPHVAYFLKQYSQQLGRQIVLITHNEHLAAVGDLSLRVSLNRKGESGVQTV